MGKPKAPPPPDYGPVAAANQRAAELNFKIAQDQLAWAKEQYRTDRKVTNSVIRKATARLDFEDKNARTDRRRYERTFIPLENKFISDAKQYASAARQNAEAGEAAADVSQQFALARSAAQDRLESFGIDPTQTRAAALDVSSRTQEAAARASAANTARERTEMLGREMSLQAINLGRGLPAQSLQGTAQATNTGNAAVNSGLATTATGSQAFTAPVGYMGQGNQSLGNWGNLLTNMYGNQIKAFEAEQKASSGWGSAVGLIGGMGVKLATGGFFKEGGAVADVGNPRDAQGGLRVTPEMSPSGGAETDDVPAAIDGQPAALNVGEFVLPADVVRWEGEKGIQKLIEKARKDKEGATAKPELKKVGLRA